MMGQRVFDRMVAADAPEEKARSWARAIAEKFGKAKKDALEIEQLAHFSPEEIAAIDALADRLAQEDRAPTVEELSLLQERHKAVDIAMFGRMIASEPRFNKEAAVQVAHAFTTHAADVEDDYFSAVDDLNRGEEDAGAGHIGEAEFGAGVFYVYICINRDQLAENLEDDQELTSKSLRALVEVATTVAPSGKQNSFASRACASYVLAERGERQPRTLALAFFDAVPARGSLSTAIDCLSETRSNINKVYYDGKPEECKELNVVAGTGSLKQVLDFVGA